MHPIYQPDPPNRVCVEGVCVCMCERVRVCVRVIQRACVILCTAIIALSIDCSDAACQILNINTRARPRRSGATLRLRVNSVHTSSTTSTLGCLLPSLPRPRCNVEEH